MDVSVRTSASYSQGNDDWVGNGGRPIGEPRSIVLDRSAFDFDADFTDGFIPQGIELAEITATGLYGPYDGAGAGGLETMSGHLYHDVPIDSDSTGDLGAALFWSGEVIEANLPAQSTLDAAGKADVVNHIAYV